MLKTSQKNAFPAWKVAPFVYWCISPVHIWRVPNERVSIEKLCELDWFHNTFLHSAPLWYRGFPVQAATYRNADSPKEERYSRKISSVTSVFPRSTTVSGGPRSVPPCKNEQPEDTVKWSGWILLEDFTEWSYSGLSRHKRRIFWYVYQAKNPASLPCSALRRTRRNMKLPFQPVNLVLWAESFKLWQNSALEAWPIHLTSLRTERSEQTSWFGAFFHSQKVCM